MSTRRKRITALVASLVAFATVQNGMAHLQDLQLNFHREITFQDGEDPCARLTCQVEGHSVTVDSVKVNEVKFKDVNRHLLTITPTTPNNDLLSSGIRGNGTLDANSNRANIVLYLLESSVCESSHFTCEVIYTKTSGARESQFATAGPGRPPSCSAQFESGHSFTNQAASSQCLLRDQINEVKFESFDKRLSQIGNGVSRFESRVDSRFDGLDTKLDRVDTRFVGVDSRFSSLEERFFSVVLLPPPVVNASRVENVEARISKIEESKESIETRLSMIEESKVNLPPGEKAEVCERGMGDDVTRWYPPYVIMTHSTIQKQIQCDTQTDGGGWIVIQKRIKGDEDFYKDWTAYREGFGSVTGDFWLGNQAIHVLTDEHPYELRIDFRIDGQEKFAHYSSFRLENEADSYRLRLGPYTGTIGGATSGLTHHNNQRFSTFDRDNDVHASQHCAVERHGAWWYSNCIRSNLNGRWNEKAYTGICWHNGAVWLYPVATEMKIRRVQTTTNG